MDYIPYGLMSHRRIKNAYSNIFDFDYIVLLVPDDADDDYYIEVVTSWMQLSEEKARSEAD